LGTAQLIACSSDSRHNSSEEVSSGSLSLPLRATAASGHVYRLREAFFSITNTANGETVAVLSSEDDLSRAVLTSIIQTGEYTVTLQPGWFMERLISSGGGTGGTAGFGSGPTTGGVFPTGGAFPSKGGAPTTGGKFSNTGGLTDIGGEGGFFEAGGAPPDEPLPTAGFGTAGGASKGGGFGTGGFPSTGGVFLGGRPGVGGTPGGEQAIFVDAQLLSPAVQFFTINSRADTFVNFTFQIGGEIIDFNEGRVNISIDVIEANPQCDTPPNVTRPERVLLENDVAALGNIRLLDVFNAVAKNGGFTGDGLRLYQEMFDSYASPDQATLPDAIHCGDETTNGAPSLNGYPIRCNRRERAHVSDPQNFRATAIINRIDFTPENGANCGQQRMIFANSTRGRTFIIVEAQIPNPKPELGVKGCLPLAQFWLDQNSIDNPFTRGDRLAQAFLVGHPDLVAQGFGPFYTATNLTIGSGQIRTNQFDDSPWTLREFKLALDGTNLKAIPFPTAEAPNGALWDENSGLPQGPACRENFLTAMQGLLTDDMSKMSFVVDHACKDAESQNDGSQDYAARTSPGFQKLLSDNLIGTGLSAKEIANRARFAGSCIGCHNESNFASLGRGVVAPQSLDFPHVSEFASTDCGSRNVGASCFPTSIALNTVFLPSRLNTLANLTGVPIVTDPCPNGGTGGGSGTGGVFGTGGKFSTGGFASGTGGIFSAGGVGGATGTAGRPGKGTPTPPPISEEPAPKIEIELPQASTPLSELMQTDAKIREQYGEKTISGRSAQSTH
jgi:hypothetical protein